MPTSSRQAFQGSPEEIDAEIRGLQAKEKDQLETLSQLISQRSNLEKLKRKAEEDEKAAERAQAERGRKNVAHSQTQSPKQTRKRPSAKELQLNARDATWDRMGPDGTCERCKERGIRCLRMEVEKHRSVWATNVQRVRIGGKVYSKCRDCKLHSGKCQIIEEIVDSSDSDADIVELAPVGAKLKGKAISKNGRDGRAARRRKNVTVKQEVPEVIISPYYHPATSGYGPVAQASGSGIQANRGEEIKGLAEKLEQEQADFRKDLAALRMQQIGFRAALSQFERRLEGRE
ncbi:hypothetical protein D9611_011887 [Ephemerocybe angulata]|uniref:Uncharacterized protein n=1 Tax=Ephemerocybe angulata TaxID=980116 RepID=A0A8H5BYM1_9AGAR|nr:hypothetical protein D9611_011887 [Tulosesus angulatus]